MGAAGKIGGSRENWGGGLEVAVTGTGGGGGGGESGGGGERWGQQGK